MSTAACARIALVLFSLFQCHVSAPRFGFESSLVRSNHALNRLSSLLFVSLRLALFEGYYSPLVKTDTSCLAIPFLVDIR